MEPESLISTLNSIWDRLAELASTQAVHNQLLEEHMRRTDVSEKRLELMEELIRELRGPFKLIKYGTLLFGAGGTVTAATLGVLELLERF